MLVLKWRRGNESKKKLFRWWWPLSLLKCLLVRGITSIVGCGNFVLWISYWDGYNPKPNMIYDKRNNISLLDLAILSLFFPKKLHYKIASSVGMSGSDYKLPKKNHWFGCQCFSPHAVVIGWLKLCCMPKRWRVWSHLVSYVKKLTHGIL